MNDIREQIEWLGAHVWLADPRVFKDLKKTMEILLARNELLEPVYEAAQAIGGSAMTKALSDALAAVQKGQTIDEKGEEHGL